MVAFGSRQKGFGVYWGDISKNHQLVILQMHITNLCKKDSKVTTPNRTKGPGCERIHTSAPHFLGL